MAQLSKSKFTLFCQCPRALWLKTFRPELEVVDANTKARFETGNEVGDLAMGLFGDYTEVTIRREDGKLDLTAMIEKTKECLANGTANICEASFSYDGNYCAVDILRKTTDGYTIYEVKSSSFPEFEGKKAKIEKYVPDIAYQKWVLTQCGINVTGTYLVCLNSDYVREGELDLQRLFVVIDMDDMVEEEIESVGDVLQDAFEVLDEEEEPDIDISENCKKPYDCAFFEHCSQHLPKPSVFDLYRMRFSDKMDYYRRGLVSYEDIQNDDLNPIRRIQVDCALEQKSHIDVKGVREFMKSLYYPLYFLDFETMQPAIPQFDGTKPYQQIPFQYSLHIIEHEGGELLHREHLGISGEDPRRALAEQLCADIPTNVCSLAYNKAFECTRLKELAEFFPDLSEHLLNIRDHIIDLLEPFQKGYYYLPSMGGSFSIKRVLPSLFPDDPSLDYHNLDERVQNGGDAMSIFPRIKDMPEVQQKEVRQALLNYCCLDTLAMVRVWENLKEV